jgi:hypothetical protein
LRERQRDLVLSASQNKPNKASQEGITTMKKSYLAGALAALASFAALLFVGGSFAAESRSFGEFSYVPEEEGDLGSDRNRRIAETEVRLRKTFSAFRNSQRLILMAIKVHLINALPGFGTSDSPIEFEHGNCEEQQPNPVHNLHLAALITREVQTWKTNREELVPLVAVADKGCA